ncbi:PEP-CTERM sorting domain-containing protein [Thiobacillus sp.]|uniref:PEP-CTERM sorting domain-containing protein n=1 Tax=Thiobacillus sp. TaxID=924 RepID=UPI00286DD4D1|nr:PEP-CTERM sorting domain-containing protein [Thiobacillus sp.]
MNYRTVLITTGLIAASLVSGAAQAALQGRNMDANALTFEAYYDTDLNITWLANANLNGLMDWAAANTWAANLSFYNPLTNQTYADWRLPTTLQPDASCGTQSGGDSYGYNCTGSEMGHLFYSELGGTAGQSILTSADPDVAKFTNLQANFYWSATEYAPGIGLAWGFYFDGGYQDVGDTSYNWFSDFHALAVSPGDVAAVPEADTWAMLLAGLTLVGAATRRRRG